MRRLQWIAGLIAAWLVICALGPAAVASPEKPRLAVVPFTGPQAKKAEAVVVRALRKKARVVPQPTWAKAAKKLFAKSHSSEDLAAVADDVGAQVVITGLVHRDGKAWQLSVSVRDGKTGKTHDRLRYPSWEIGKTVSRYTRSPSALCRVLRLFNKPRGIFVPGWMTNSAGAAGAADRAGAAAGAAAGAG